MYLEQQFIINSKRDTPKVQNTGRMSPSEMMVSGVKKV